MSDNRSIDIERALETVRLFSQPHEIQSLPTLEHFELQDGKLLHSSKSVLEKTLAFTKDCLACTFSSVMRNKQLEKKKAITGTLQQSLDLLKVYSAAIGHLQKGSEGDKSLANRLLVAANTYNAFVRQAKLPPQTVSGMLKLFFLKMAGWTVDEELIKNEIHIPQRVEISSLNASKSLDSLSGHKISFKEKSITAKKVLSILQASKRYASADLSMPKLEELDLFRIKAITLLQNQEMPLYTLAESVELVHTTPIEYAFHDGAFLLNGSIIELRQMISNFPGVEIELKGAFQRDNFHPELVLPLKDSYQFTCYTLQTGFPHPLQYTGIALHEKLLPTLLLRPQRCPRVQALFEVKNSLCQDLVPGGTLYFKAKALLKKRKEIFAKSNSLFELQKHALITHMVALGIDQEAHLTSFFDSLSQNTTATESWFEVLSQASYTFTDKVIAQPIRQLQQEWLLINSRELRTFTYEECQAIMYASIEKSKAEIIGPFSPLIVETIGKACAHIHLMQLSEHLNYEPPQLSSYEQKLLIWLVRQQLLFAFELHAVDVESLEEFLEQTIRADSLLFENKPISDSHTLEAQELVRELINYYTMRYESPHR